MQTTTTASSATYRRPWLAPYQRDAIFCPERYSLVEASTKSGKTVACLVWLFEQAARGRAGRSYWWVAPVYTQAEIAYRRMKDGIPRSLYRSNDTERRLELANGTLLWFKSGEKPDNLYGDDVYAAVVDEASRLREESWHAVRSTLTQTRGPVRIIGNVKGRGNWFYKLARRAQRGEGGMRYSRIRAADAVHAGILQQAEIEDAKEKLPEHVYLELYEAEAAALQGRIYKSFGDENVRDDLVDLGGTLLVGMDFNVDPMTAVIGSRAVDELHIFDEVVLHNSNTQEMADELRARYPERSITVYPDPSGAARKTATAKVGETDFTILRASGLKVVAPRSAPAVVDRINEVNAMARAASGHRRLFVHPKCSNLLEAIEGLIWKEGTSQPDKASGYDHITDALGYLIHAEFPMGDATGGAISTIGLLGA